MRVELYDASGTLASAVEYDYDAMARLIRRQVDTNGNGTFDSAQKFVYDGTQVTFRTSAGVKTKEVTYKYDAFDRRIAKDVDTNGDGVIDGGERFIYDGGDLVLKTDAAGTITNRYLHGPDFDQVFADESSVDGILWALADNLGTVRDWVEYDDMTDTTSVANRLDYDAFGNIVSQSNPNHTTQFGFTGQDWDADVGLYHYSDGEGNGRWYDPVSGTFTKPDDAGFTAGDVNLYRYVGNGPTNATDPSGLAEYSPWKPWTYDWDYWNDVKGASTGFGKTIVRSLDPRNANFIPALKELPNDFKKAKSLCRNPIDYGSERARVIAKGLNDKLSTAEGNGELIADGLGLYLLGRAALGPRGVSKAPAAGGRATAASGGAEAGAKSPQSLNNLNRKLGSLEKAQQKAASTRTLPDGRFRYYGPESPARNPGPTRGRSHVTEYDPASGRVRSWEECYDQAGKVSRVHPKDLNGQILDLPHYPPIGSEL